jgi:hypothetical protein
VLTDEPAFNDPNATVLFGQVRRATASHKVDLEHGLLRNRHFNGHHNVLYLGDLAAAVLAHLPHAETPVVNEVPGFNEQRWCISTRSGDLNVSIRSLPYWGWGLMTSGYLNMIHLIGPQALKHRLALDVANALGRRPWEWVRPSKADRTIRRWRPDADVKTNETAWKGMIEAGKADLAEQIHRHQDRWRALQPRLDGDDEEAIAVEIDDDVHAAQSALAEGRASAVERALARVEAKLMLIDPETAPERSRIDSVSPNELTLTPDPKRVTSVDYAAILEEA